MFDINGWEFTVLVLLALFIFGPDRLPKVIADGMRMVRTLRGMARNATTDLSRELGTDINIEDLNPRSFIRKHLLSEEDEAAIRRPIDEAVRDIRRPIDETVQDVKQVKTNINGVGAPRRDHGAGPDGARSEPHAYDTDAT